MFVWVRHAYSESVKRVKNSLEDFSPEILGIEISKNALELQKVHKHNHKSELFLAYQYGIKHRLKIELMDDEGRSIHKKALDKVGLLGLVNLVFWFLLNNVIRLLKGQKLKKLQIEDSPILKHYIIDRRDDLFSKKVKKIISENPDKRILFIFGKSHKEGILQRLN